MSTIDEQLDTIAACSASLRQEAKEHHRLGIYEKDCVKIADTTDALVAEVRLLRAALALHMHIRSCAECSGPDDGCDEGQGLEHAAFSCLPFPGGNPYDLLRPDRKLGQP